MAVKPLWTSPPQFVDANGDPYSGALMFFYAAGSSTKQNAYTDDSGGTACDNPTTLNSSGYPVVSGSVFTPWGTVGQTYKIGLAAPGSADPPASFIWTSDDISPINDTNVSIDQWVSGATPTYVSATSFTLVGDQTSTYHVGRRLKTTNSGGTVYSSIVTSVFGALTTVTVVNDSGTLDSGLSAVAYGLMSATNPSTPLLDDSYPVVSGSADKTKKIRDEADNLTTNTTRVRTMPDVDLTLGYQAYAKPRFLENVGIAVTMAANAVTVALKTAGGSDPSSGSPVIIGFRNATIATGQASKVAITGAMSVSISSGSTMGTVSAQASRIWIGAINNAGAVELALFQSVSGTSIAQINEAGVITTTAEGGAGGADTAQTWYSTTSRASVPVTVLGYFDSTQGTAGTWATSVTSIVVDPKRRPNDVLQQFNTTLGTVATGTNVTPADNTIPQLSTETNVFISQAFTPSAAANLIVGESELTAASSGSARVVYGLWKDTTEDALKVISQYGSAANAQAAAMVKHRFVANQITSLTLKAAAAGTAAGTTTVNGESGGQLYGGVSGSYLLVEERMV